MKRNRKKRPALGAYSVDETAAILGIGTSTVRRRIEDGVIPVIDGLGRITRIPRWWVDQRIAQNEPSTGAVEPPQC
jgi:excisionase family DNA binding protein